MDIFTRAICIECVYGILDSSVKPLSFGLSVGTILVLVVLDFACIQKARLWLDNIKLDIITVQHYFKTKEARK